MSHSLQVRGAPRAHVTAAPVGPRSRILRGRLFPARGPGGKRNARDLPTLNRSKRSNRSIRVGLEAAGPWHRAIAASARHVVASGAGQRPTASAGRKRKSLRPPLEGDETGKVGGTSRPRPRSSTFAPSCRRPPNSLSRRTAIRTRSGGRRGHAHRLIPIPLEPYPAGRPLTGSMTGRIRSTRDSAVPSADRSRCSAEKSFLRQAARSTEDHTEKSTVSRRMKLRRVAVVSTMRRHSVGKRRVVKKEALQPRNTRKNEGCFFREGDRAPR